jgi:hypothetical protein
MLTIGRSSYRGHAPRGKRAELKTRKPAWLGACALLLLLGGPPALSIWSAYSLELKNRATEEDLAANFRANEAHFAELIDLLAEDRERLRLEPIDLAALSHDLPAARARIYEELLGRIAVADIRYFTASGELILLPEGGPANTNAAPRWYRYLPQGEPEPIAQHHGYAWRGPGMYSLSGDRPLESRWFIHHNKLVEVAFAPY